MMTQPTLAILLLAPVVAAAQDAAPAFPGAEGFGTQTPGGRGGRVIVVDSLADRGPGTFRAACEEKGPRIIVFAVGGYVTLESDVHLTSPYCTIAGQTAPGGGVCIRGGGLNIATHDVVVRHLRFRMGRLPDEKVTHFRDCVSIVGVPPVHHVVIDHCSISWAMSRNLITWGDAHDITVQWSIISEPLRDPGDTDRALAGMGFLIGNMTEHISVHHCLFAHNYQRNPRLKHGVHADLVNNVVHNPGGRGSAGVIAVGDFEKNAGAPAVEANLVGNWFQPGENTRDDVTLLYPLTTARVYRSDNVTDLPWLTPDLTMPLSFVDDPFPAAPVTTYPAKEAFERVLAHAGATLPRRDAVDTRVVDEVRRRTGRHIKSQDDVGGWPDLPETHAPPDTDPSRLVNVSASPPIASHDDPGAAHELKPPSESPHRSASKPASRSHD